MRTANKKNVTHVGGAGPWYVTCEESPRLMSARVIVWRPPEPSVIWGLGAPSRHVLGYVQ
jgi:hypothetical protein